MFFFLNIFTTCSFRNFAHFQFLPIWFCHILNIFWNLKSILKWFSSLYAFLGDMFSWVIHLQRVNPQNSHFSCILCLTFGTSVGWHNCLGKNKTMQDNICSLVTRFFSTHTPQLLPFFFWFPFEWQCEPENYHIEIFFCRDLVLHLNHDWKPEKNQFEDEALRTGVKRRINAVRIHNKSARMTWIDRYTTQTFL